MRERTFPALERLKADAEGVDVLVELVPEWLAGRVEWLFESEYREKRREITARRDEYRRRYKRGTSRIQKAYGSVVARAVRDRRSGADPRYDLDRALSELHDAKADLDELGDRLDEDYLLRSERRLLAELTDEVVAALEFVANARDVRATRNELEPEIAAFERRFEPYAGGDRYMVTSDAEFLTEQCRLVWDDVVDASRRLQLDVLPDDHAEWLTRTRARFRRLVDELPAYNESFVRRERARYDDLLTTEHGPLNEQQRKAVVRDDRRNLVDASAGTGKTLTLTYRFLYLLEKGVPVTDVVAVTYTTDAAAEMRARIAEAADVRESDLNVSTIHSFARSVLERSGRLGDGSYGSPGAFRDELVDAAYGSFQRSRDEMAFETPDGVDCSDAYDDFVDAATDFFRSSAAVEHVDEERYRRTRDEFVREKLRAFVSEARTFGRTPAAVRRELDPSDEAQYAFGLMGAALLDAYTRCVEAVDEPLDYDEMIYAATEEVRSNPDRFGSLYSHVLVDEFQDVSHATFSFVESFMEADSDGSTHLFCVGDDWQSIYGFSGSDVEFFTGFDDDYEQVAYTALELNYRCPPAVVEAGATLMANSSADQNRKPVSAVSDSSTSPTLHEFTGLYEARAPAYVVDLVRERLDDGVDYDDVMILSRNDEQSRFLDDVRARLEAAEIPHRRPDDERDYLPPGYVDRFDRSVAYENGDAVFESGDGGSPSVPMVAVQSVHRSKGTEAPVVVLANALDEERDGIPQERRENPLLAPARDVTADHYAEERRLFYVALTRTEDEFHAVSRRGVVSRYLSEIRDYVECVPVPPADELVGRCVDVAPPTPGSNQPYKFTLETESYPVTVSGWFDDGDVPFEVDGVYRLSDYEVADTGYGEEIPYASASVERVDAADAPHSAQ